MKCCGRLSKGVETIVQKGIERKVLKQAVSSKGSRPLPKINKNIYLHSSGISKKQTNLIVKFHYRFSDDEFQNSDSKIEKLNIFYFAPPQQ